MTWVNQADVLSSAARRIDPAVTLTTKDGVFWRALAYVLPIVTAGGMSRRTFLHDYATTIGPIQAYPRQWSAEMVRRLLVHEARHTRQFRWFALGLNPWLGVPLMGLCYALFPLPLGFAYVRYRLELDADVADWRVRLAQGESPSVIRQRAVSFGGRVASGAYGWAWPRRWCLKGFCSAADREIGLFDRADETAAP